MQQKSDIVLCEELRSLIKEKKWCNDDKSSDDNLSDDESSNTSFDSYLGELYGSQPVHVSCTIHQGFWTIRNLNSSNRGIIIISHDELFETLKQSDRTVTKDHTVHSKDFVAYSNDCVAYSNDCVAYPLRRSQQKSSIRKPFVIFSKKQLASRSSDLTTKD